MMGSGKSSVAEAIAARTGWPAYDNDTLLVEKVGMDAATLLSRDGVDALRDAESAVLHDVLRRKPPFVSGVAAGVVTREVDRAALRDDGAFVVWLRARLDTLVRNVASGAGRPWLQPDPTSALRALGAGRDRFFLAVADLVVDVDDVTAEQVADRILSSLGWPGP